MPIPAYTAGLYLRLSRDDEQQGDSSSIITQRQMLKKYANENNIAIYDEYVDDGWSGTNFDRPDFQRMIQDIELGYINCVIVKDLSRLGRNYILTGQYTELYFPSHNVRFIAITDNVDSNNGDNEFAPFKNIINEWYAKDISKKVHSALQTKFAMGERYCAYPPLGYVKNPENHGRFIIDEETRWIIEKIFNYASEGMGAGRITKALITEQIPTPSWFNFKRDGTFAHIYENQPEEKKYMWTLAQVKKILKDETYIGNSIHNRQTTKSFKCKQKVRKPESEWLRIENTHEPIIDREQFFQVQEMIKSRRREQKDKTVQVFAGLVKCADCGWSMRFGTNKANKNPYSFFSCSRYGQMGKIFCSMHYIRYDTLYEYVLSRIQYWTNIAQEDEEKLLEYLMKCGDKEFASSRQRNISELKKSEKRLKELDVIFGKLYEDRMSGNINERNFNMLSAKYQVEQEELQETIDSLTKKLKEEKEDISGKEKWIALLKQYINPQELTAPLLNSLIDKILIHEAVTAEDGVKEQEVEIFYKFIGKID